MPPPVRRAPDDRRTSLTDGWMTASTSSRHASAFDGFLAAACLPPASEPARGTMTSSYRRTYLLPLFFTVQNCTLDAARAGICGGATKPIRNHARVDFSLGDDERGNLAAAPLKSRQQPFDMIRKAS